MGKVGEGVPGAGGREEGWGRPRNGSRQLRVGRRHGFLINYTK